MKLTSCSSARPPDVVQAAKTDFRDFSSGGSFRVSSHNLNPTLNEDHVINEKREKEEKEAEEKAKEVDPYFQKYDLNNDEKRKEQIEALVKNQPYPDFAPAFVFLSLLL